MALTLTTVEAAITEIQDNGQSVEMDGMTYDAANLGTLFEIRNQLKSEQSRADDTRPVFRRFNMSGMGY